MPEINLDPQEVLSGALLSAQRIGSVFPIYGIVRNTRGVLVCSCRGSKSCHPGKHPIGRGWKKRATSDPETIREWLLEKYPGANYGIATGFSPVLDDCLVVIDADLKDGENGIVSMDQEALDSGEPLAETVMVETGGGGRHWYYRAPLEASRNRDNLLPGVDIRGSGGYVLGANSLHSSGRRYSYPEEYGPTEQSIVVCPAFVLNLLNNQHGRPAGDTTDCDDIGFRLESDRQNRSAGRSTYVIDFRANPPERKYQRMFHSSARFRETVRHKRKDLRDTSFSSYMMALAGMVVSAGWTDQEVVDLLSAFLRCHKAFRKPSGQFRLTRSRVDSMLGNAKRYASLHPKVEKPPFRQNQVNLERIVFLLKTVGPMRQTEIAQRTGIDYAVVKNIISRWSSKRLWRLADHLIGVAPEERFLVEATTPTGPSPLPIPPSV